MAESPTFDGANERAEMLKQLVDLHCWLGSGIVGQREEAERAVAWAIRELLVRKAHVDYRKE